jgi:hypothetical protein
LGVLLISIACSAESGGWLLALTYKCVFPSGLFLLCVSFLCLSSCFLTLLECEGNPPGPELVNCSSLLQDSTLVCSGVTLATEDKAEEQDKAPLQRTETRSILQVVVPSSPTVSEGRSREQTVQIALSLSLSLSLHK